VTHWEHYVYTEAIRAAERQLPLQQETPGIRLFRRLEAWNDEPDRTPSEVAQLLRDAAGALS
jgi:hypothetical protein